MKFSLPPAARSIKRSRGVTLAFACMFLAAALPVRAQVQDNANIFSREAVQQANDIISGMQSKHRHDLLVVTYPAIPDSESDNFKSKSKAQFYQDWIDSIGKSAHISGVVVLMVMDPGHLQIAIGNETKERLFTDADRTEMQPKLNEVLGKKQYDDALLRTAKFVSKRMDEHDPRNTGATGASTTPPPVPGGQPAQGQGPPYSNTTRAKGFGIGALFCLIAGVLIVVFLIRAVFRSRGGGQGGGGNYGGGYPPQGQGYPPQGQGYPPPVGGYGPGYGQPQRSGFGSGFLGGLLGGAVGGYATDRLLNHGQSAQGGVPSGPVNPGASADPGGSFQPDTSFDSTGSDFGSAGGGSDFGTSDSSGGGSDFGGGGGGDSGASSGGSDF